MSIFELVFFILREHQEVLREHFKQGGGMPGKLSGSTVYPQLAFTSDFKNTGVEPFQVLEELVDPTFELCLFDLPLYRYLVESTADHQWHQVIDPKSALLWVKAYDKDTLEWIGVNPGKLLRSWQEHSWKRLHVKWLSQVSGSHLQEI